MTAVLDPSIYLELALDQQQKAGCKQVLNGIFRSDVDAALTDYHRDGICYILGEAGGREPVQRFLVFIDRSQGLSQCPLSTFDMYRATEVMESDGLDFDDACAVVAARELDSHEIVALDDDYDDVDDITRLVPTDLI